YIVVSPVAVFFLTLDRLLTLSYGHAYGRREKTCVLYVEVLVLVAVALGLLGLTLALELPLQWGKSRHRASVRMWGEEVKNGVFSRALRDIRLHSLALSEHLRLLHKNRLRRDESRVHMRVSPSAEARLRRQEQRRECLAGGGERARAIAHLEDL